MHWAVYLYGVSASTCDIITYKSHTVVHMIVIHVHRAAVLNPLGGRSFFNLCGTSEKAVHLAYNQHIMLLYSLTQHDDCTCSYIDNLTLSCCYSVELMACLTVHLYISMTLMFCVYRDLNYHHMQHIKAR